LTCTGSSFEGVLQHINFGPVTGAGAHGCTALNIAGHDPAVTTLLLDDLYVFNDTGLCSTGTGSNYWLQVPDFYSGGVTFSNVYADFNNSVWDTKMGGCAGTTACNPWIIDFLANTVTGKYVVVRNPAGNPLTGTHGLGSVQTFQYVWIENWTSRGPNGHTEAYDGSSGSGITPLANAVAGGLTFDHPVFLQGQNVSNFGTGPIWTASNYPFAITNGPKVLSGTFINSFVGGRPKAGVTFSGCWGGSFSGGVCGAPGASNHLYITSETGTLGYGADVDCTGGSFVTYKSVTPTGGAIEEYIVDGFSGTQYGPAFQISASAVTCTSKTVGPAIGGTDAVISTRAATPFGSPNFSGNYLDVTSFSGSPGSQTIWQIKQVDNNVSVPSGTITTSLGVSTLNTGGPSAQYGAYVNGVGVDGCSLGIQGCPRIASGSAGVYTLDTAVTPIGPIAMTVVPWNWCAVPAVVAGNVDMAALISDASLNKMSSVTAGNGCVAPAVFTPPTLTPSISSNFNPNVTSNFTSNSLSPNGGAAGALEFPTTPTNSAAFYFEAVVDPALAYGFNGEFLFSGMTMDGNTNPGQPAFLFNRLSNGQQGAWWWLNPGMNYASGGSATAGSGYVNGIYPVTAPNSGCIRAPSGVWRGLTNIFQQTDPGLGCPTGTLSLNAAAIAANVPNSGAQQTATSATCASGGAGILVTTSVPVSPGLSPGLQYTVNLTGTGRTSLFGATLTATSVTGSGPY
ncbi:MAG TPA: hypothetical protein VNX46_17065, partial [Candidatus Acidoferrum sp.]|nr:hypothetical protein [Candidatus Acidoferrum sp.]